MKSDSLEVGAYFQVHGVSIEDGKLELSTPSLVKILEMNSYYVLVEYIDQFEAKNKRLRRWLSMALFFELHDEYFAIAVHPIRLDDAKLLIEEEQKLLKTTDQEGISEYKFSLEKASTDIQEKLEKMKR